MKLGTTIPAREVGSYALKMAVLGVWARLTFCVSMVDSGWFARGIRLFFP